jgi:hypothetical protein
MVLENLIAGAGSYAIQEIASNKDVRSWIGKLMHRIWKRIFLKKLQCVIIEDSVRSNLNDLKLNDQYVVVNLENTLKAMMNDSAVASMMALKQENYDLYCLTYSIQLKQILGALRARYRRNKQVIVLLSSVQMAEYLHIEDYTVFQMNDAMFEDFTESKPLSEKELAYVKRMRNIHLKLSSMNYASIAQLQEHIQMLYK